MREILFGNTHLASPPCWHGTFSYVLFVNLKIWIIYCLCEGQGGVGARDIGETYTMTQCNNLLSCSLLDIICIYMCFLPFHGALSIVCIVIGDLIFPWVDWSRSSIWNSLFLERFEISIFLFLVCRLQVQGDKSILLMITWEKPSYTKYAQFIIKGLDLVGNT